MRAARKEERAALVDEFRGFGPWVTWLLCFWACGKVSGRRRPLERGGPPFEFPPQVGEMLWR